MRVEPFDFVGDELSGNEALTGEVSAYTGISLEILNVPLLPQVVQRTSSERPFP
jgi:hypothetical protein